MVRSCFRMAVAAVLLCGMTLARADESGTAIDLTTFGQLIDEAASAPVADDLPLQEVARRFDAASRRFYVSAMIGPAFSSVDSPGTSTLISDDTLFSAGGAIGVAFERERGRLRLEVEGMGRDTYDAPFIAPPQPGAATVLTNNWSVLQNFWRDFMVTDRLGIYGGGGIGAGGYILGDRLNEDTIYVTPTAAFAWQAGGGLLWEVTERLTFDVGYRFFQIDTIRQADLVQVFPNQFSANELMFTLRLYEPFRNWRQ